ncbi:macro domain-containing protein [Sporosarcina sp. E16_3]|uniref:type II toxin-antitoxin system antitoxin DNA ADP-ribosyl glycohydrolase DarG n=1 Tax=Sporosarcina sp. E16_3 TaxID=2789293 RepID=UPI001A924D18|nr:macro domain-containing protein [Sporosarcina sp. E16_3]MBO0601186.1 macro domain-containing protein [Sporosarcina sp. E16_3]
MIILSTGNLLEDQAEAYVNTVNTVGVMGKGIALQFKQAFPDVFKQYAKACKQGLVEVGSMHVVQVDGLTNPKYIINFPTKKHWRDPSEMSYIESGLEDLVNVIKKMGIQSIAIPPLGCGNGGLDWADVKPKIEQAFKNESVNVHLYGPAGSPRPDQVKIGTKEPRMTKGRALLLSLMESYSVPGYRLSHLEIQKLAYFLQEVGEPMELRFEKNKYGPYAENLNHVLQRIDGHFIRGYGDRTREAEIYILDGAAERAMKSLQKDKDSLERLERVKEIIHGFETPYGMELLSTVHWVMKHSPDRSEDLSFVTEQIQNWNMRKKELFTEKHIEKVWHYLQSINTAS